MNGPIKMYQTRQIIRHDLPIELPKCMYTLKNIHSRKNGMVDQSTDHVTSPKKKLDIFEQVKQFLKVLNISIITKVFLNFLTLFLHAKNTLLTIISLKITCMTCSYQFLRTTVK